MKEGRGEITGVMLARRLWSTYFMHPCTQKDWHSQENNLLTLYLDYSAQRDSLPTDNVPRLLNGKKWESRLVVNLWQSWQLLIEHMSLHRTSLQSKKPWEARSKCSDISNARSLCSLHEIISISIWTQEAYWCLRMKAWASPAEQNWLPCMSCWRQIEIQSIIISFDHWLDAGAESLANYYAPPPISCGSHSHDSWLLRCAITILKMKKVAMRRGGSLYRPSHEHMCDWFWRWNRLPCWPISCILFPFLFSALPLEIHFISLRTSLWANEICSRARPYCGASWYFRDKADGIPPANIAPPWQFYLYHNALLHGFGLSSARGG